VLATESFRHVPINFSLSVRPFICPHVTTREPINGFSWHTTLGSFTKICRHFPVISSDRTAVTIALNEYLWAFAQKSGWLEYPQVALVTVVNMATTVSWRNLCAKNTYPTAQPWRESFIVTSWPSQKGVACLAQTTLMSLASFAKVKRQILSKAP
jgi:hypothetical protein